MRVGQGRGVVNLKLAKLRVHLLAQSNGLLLVRLRSPRAGERHAADIVIDDAQRVIR